MSAAEVLSQLPVPAVVTACLVATAAFGLHRSEGYHHAIPTVAKLPKYFKEVMPTSALLATLCVLAVLRFPPAADGRPTTLGWYLMLIAAELAAGQVTLIGVTI
eukprot:gene3914-5970_t